MGHDRRKGKLKFRYKVFYVLSIVALAVLLCVNFGIVYTLLITPPKDPESMMRLFYLTMVAGFLILCAQGLLVTKRIISALDRDNAAVAELTERLEQMAMFDDLTKAYNRSKFEEVAGREMNNVRRYAHDLAGIIFDVDDFRAINDEHGYRAGDKLIANLAHYIDGKLRNNDYLFRWRGGKFVILAPHTDIDQAAMLAEKLRQIVGHKIFGGTIRMTISLGVAQAEMDDSVETFVHRLQTALVGAKNSGRNRVTVNRASASMG